MASFKCVFFLFSVVLLASQAQAAAVAVKDDSNILDILRNVLKAVADISGKLLAIAKQLVDGTDDVDNIQKTLIADVSDLTSNIVKAVVAALNVAQKSKLSGCIESSESKITNAVTSVVRDFTSCFKNDLISIAPKLDSLLNDLTELHDKDIEIGMGLEQCDDIECFKNVGGKILENVKSKLPELLADLKTIAAENPSIGKDAIQCALSNLIPLVNNIEEIKDEITTCNAA